MSMILTIFYVAEIEEAEAGCKKMWRADGKNVSSTIALPACND
jgi:hypothetical protein